MPLRRLHARARRRDAPVNFPIAYVKYYDHCWLRSKELEEIRNAKPYVVEETGFLLKETPDYITLAKERSTDGEQGKTTFDDVTILMRSDIVDLRVFPLEGAPLEVASSGSGIPRRKAKRR